MTQTGKSEILAHFFIPPLKATNLASSTLKPTRRYDHLSNNCPHALLLLAAMISVAMAGACEVSSCSPTDPLLPLVWLNTSSHRASLQGLQLRAYTILPNGEISDGQAATWQISAVSEHLSSDSGACDLSLDDRFETQWPLMFDQLCCRTSVEQEIIDGNVSRTSAVVWVTNPQDAAFLLKFKVSAANDNYTTSVEDTTYTRGLNLSTTFSYVLELGPPCFRYSY